MEKLKQIKYGAVAAGHQKTAEVAMEVLRSGGNATDALIAAYVASFVAEPCMGSPGGGAFALIHERDGKPAILDFFCQTPLIKKNASDYDFIPYTVNFDDDTEVFYYGKGSAATPGAIAGIFAMHRHSGSMPVKTLFSQGLELMKTGVPLSWFQHYDISLLKGIIGHSRQGREYLLNEKGGAPEIGTPVRLPALADFMEVIANEGPGEFYEGYYAEMQQKIFDHQGGSLQYQDFLDYKVEIRSPLKFAINDATIFCNPSPALGGRVMMYALQQLHEKPEVPEYFSSDYFSRFFEAFARARYFQLNPGKYGEWIGHQMNRKWGSTSHISITDAMGNSAALTTTIGEGNGHFDPLSLTHMNNMLGESALLPDGFHSWIPNRRLSSMMNPVIVKRRNDETLVLGTGGAGRIPYALSCTLWNYLTAGMALEEAVKVPRVHLDDRFFHVEKILNPHDLPNLRLPYKFWRKPSLFFGGVHAVLAKSTHSAIGIGDFRREGFYLAE